jgi:hypothetical protein
LTRTSAGASLLEVGPYELQDFNLCFITRHGFRPSKVAFLAWNTWGDKKQGVWPDLLPAEKRNEYDPAAIKQWLEVFSSSRPAPSPSGQRGSMVSPWRISSVALAYLP